MTRNINGIGWVVMSDQESVDKAVEFFNNGEVIYIYLFTCDFFNIMLLFAAGCLCTLLRPAVRREQWAGTVRLGAPRAPRGRAITAVGGARGATASVRRAPP